MVSRRCACALICSVALIPVAACSSAGSSGTDHHLRVVTSTDVYADIVHAIAGTHVEVTSFIDNPDQDPHSYEANTRNQLAISKADVIVENGGGYDDFVDRMRSATDTPATTINVVHLSGHVAPAGGGLNEHVWYDFPTVQKLVDRLVNVLGTEDPHDRAGFRANATTFARRLRVLETTEATIRTADRGAGVAITEAVPLYLLTACGLVNRTPAAFSRAVEDGTGVSASVLKQTRDLFGTHAVRVLVYNAQTSGPETTQVLDAAKANNVAVVPVTETLPSGEDYLSWMRANLTALRSALAA